MMEHEDVARVLRQWLSTINIVPEDLISFEFYHS